MTDIFYKLRGKLQIVLDFYKINIFWIQYLFWFIFMKRVKNIIYNSCPVKWYQGDVSTRIGLGWLFRCNIFVKNLLTNFGGPSGRPCGPSAEIWSQIFSKNVNLKINPNPSLAALRQSWLLPWPNQVPNPIPFWEESRFWI